MYPGGLEVEADGLCEPLNSRFKGPLEPVSSVIKKETRGRWHGAEGSSCSSSSVLLSSLELGDTQVYSRA